MEKKIHIYSKGLVACSVCAPCEMSTKDVERAVNAENPTGISSQWTIVKENFHDGSPNPKVCEENPERKHYLLNC